MCCHWSFLKQDTSMHHLDIDLHHRTNHHHLNRDIHEHRSKMNQRCLDNRLRGLFLFDLRTHHHLSLTIEVDYLRTHLIGFPSHRRQHQDSRSVLLMIVRRYRDNYLEWFLLQDPLL